MVLLIPTVNTRSLPSTRAILSHYLPSVLTSTCFNDDQLPFALEVESTEIGHLFEHILLEYLCHFKLMKGFSNAEYSGVTRWDWQEDPWGMFHITINSGFDDVEILSQALQQSILLLQVILHSAEMFSTPTPSIPTESLISPMFDTVEH